jgi:hypothetical protein
MSDFEDLLGRLRRVEALHARTDVAGERVAPVTIEDQRGNR